VHVPDIFEGYLNGAVRLDEALVASGWKRDQVDGCLAANGAHFLFYYPV
jgi:hypothetical protein